MVKQHISLQTATNEVEEALGSSIEHVSSSPFCGVSPEVILFPPSTEALPSVGGGLPTHTARFRLCFCFF